MMDVSSPVEHFEEITAKSLLHLQLALGHAPLDPAERVVWMQGFRYEMVCN